MDEGKELSIEVKKRSIFQRLRQRHVINQIRKQKISLGKFLQMPAYIKEDERILHMFVNYTNVSDIELRAMNPEIICKVKNDLEFLKGFPPETIHRILSKGIINPYLYSDEERKGLLKMLVDAGRTSAIKDIQWGYMPTFSTDIYNTLLQEGRIEDANKSLQYLDEQVLRTIIDEDPSKIQYLDPTQKKQYESAIKEKLGQMAFLSSKYDYVSKRLSAFKYLEPEEKSKILKMCFDNGIYDVWDEISQNDDDVPIYMKEIEEIIRSKAYGIEEKVKEIAPYIPVSKVAIMIKNKDLLLDAGTLIKNLTEEQLAEFFDTEREWVVQYRDLIDLPRILAEHEKYHCIPCLREDQREQLVNKFNQLSLEEQVEYAKTNARLLIYLPTEEQVKLLEGHLENIKFCTLDAKKAYINGHPNDFFNIDEESKLELVAEDIRLYEFLPEKLKHAISTDMTDKKRAKICGKFIQQDVKNSKRFNIERAKYNGIDDVIDTLFEKSEKLSTDQAVNYVLHSKVLPSIGKLSSYQDLLHGITGGEEILGIDSYTTAQVKTIQSLDIETVKKLVQIDSNYILPYLAGSKKINRLEPSEVEETKARAEELFISLFGTEKFEQYKDCIETVISLEQEYSEQEKTRNFQSGFNMVHDFESYREHMSIPTEEFKILFNPQIIERCDPETIKTYFEKLKNHEDVKAEFEEIINQTYGSRAVEILHSRPQLDVHSINSLEVFDERILDTYGEGFVHDCITYNIRNFAEFLDAVKDPEKSRLFHDYYKILSSVYGKNAETMQKSITEFSYVADLLANIKDTDLSSKQALNLINVLCSEKNDLNIETLQDLDNYEQLATKQLESILSQADSLTNDELKQKLCKNIFGIDYEENFSKGYGKTLKNLTELYDISEGETSKGEYTEQEKTLLEIMNFIKQENDSQRVVEFIRNLKDITQIRDLAAINALIDKVQEKELSQMNSHITTMDKLDKICEEQVNETNPTVYKEEKDGVPIYHLNGVEFCMFAHNSGNTSLEDLLEFEGQGGNTAICSRLVSPRVGTFSEKYLYGAIPNQGLIAISKRDAGTQHIAKRTKMIAAKRDTKITELERLEGDSGNEVAMYRKQRDHKNITNENHGGTIAPMAYSVYSREVESPERLQEQIDRLKGKNIALVIVHSEAYRDKTEQTERTQATENKDENLRG